MSDSSLRCFLGDGPRSMSNGCFSLRCKSRLPLLPASLPPHRTPAPWVFKMMPEKQTHHSCRTPYQSAAISIISAAKSECVAAQCIRKYPSMNQVLAFRSIPGFYKHNSDVRPFRNKKLTSISFNGLPACLRPSLRKPSQVNYERSSR